MNLSKLLTLVMGGKSSVLDSLFDQGSSAAITAVDATTYRIEPIEHFNTQFLWWAIRSNQFSGAAPHFLVTNTHRRVSPDTDERMCVWSTSLDTNTWYDFDNVAVGASDTEFYNDTPFPAGVIYIASLPVYNYARSARIFASWLTDARATDLTGATLLTARASVDGRTASRLPILAGMWTNASGYTKNKMILTSGNHPDETTGRLALEGCMAWLLGGSVEAEFLLDWYEVYVYPAINPQGVEMGYFRSSPQTAASDNNRLWDGAGVNEAVDLVKARMDDDTGGAVAVGIDFHSAAGERTAIAYFDVWDGTEGIYPALDAAYDSFQAQTFVSDATVTTMLRYLWRDVYSAAIAAVFEITGRKATTIPQIMTSGRYVAQAISKMLATGQFSNNPGVGSRDMNGTTDRIDFANPGNPKGAALTISLWLKADAVGHISYFACIHDALDASYGVIASAGTTTQINFVRKGTTDYTWSVTPDNLVDGLWHNLLITSNGGLLTGSTVIYLDGTSRNITFTNGSGAETEHSGSLSLGGRIYSDTRNFDGKLAQVGLWNRVLSAAEIAALAAGYAPSVAAASGLQFYLKANTDSLVAAPGGEGTADGTTQVTGVGTGPTIYY
jgi:hypothetical protein